RAVQGAGPARNPARRGSKGRLTVPSEPPPAYAELSGPLRTAVQTIRQRPVPQSALYQALDRACGVRRRDRFHVLGRLRLPAGAAAAALLLAGLAHWLTRVDHLWAGVTDAVRARPWIHATGTDSSGETWEFWLAPNRQISAWRLG